MHRLDNHLIGVDQGNILMFSDYEDSGPMWAGEGTRTVYRKVLFSAPFKAPPAVTVGVAMWDSDSGTNQRGDLSADNVTETGFLLTFRTWGDSRLARLRANWLAIGPLAHEDDWDLS